MSQINVNTIGTNSGNTISVASGKSLLNASGKELSNGLLEFDQWSLTANIDGGSNNILIDSNLSRPTGKLQGGYKGSGMTVSSGIWTFPSTGYWKIEVHCTFEVNNDYASEICIEATDDNSSYDRIARGDSGNRQSAGFLDTATCTVIIDIEDTSTDKIKFVADSMASNSDVIGSSNEIYTGFIFMKLADT